MKLSWLGAHMNVDGQGGFHLSVVGQVRSHIEWLGR